MFRGNKVGDTEEQISKDQEEKHTQDREISSKRRDEKQHCQETPHDQVDTQGESVSSLITLVRGFNAEFRQHEHSETQPERAVGTVDCRTEGVADTEFHQTCEDLGSSAHEDHNSEGGLVWTHVAFWV